MIKAPVVAKLGLLPDVVSGYLCFSNEMGSEMNRILKTPITIVDINITPDLPIYFAFPLDQLLNGEKGAMSICFPITGKLKRGALTPIAEISGDRRTVTLNDTGLGYIAKELLRYDNATKEEYRVGKGDNFNQPIDFEMVLIYSFFIWHLVLQNQKLQRGFHLLDLYSF